MNVFELDSNQMLIAVAACEVGKKDVARIKAELRQLRTMCTAGERDIALAGRIVDSLTGVVAHYLAAAESLEKVSRDLQVMAENDPRAYVQERQHFAAQKKEITSRLMQVDWLLLRVNDALVSSLNSLTQSEEEFAQHLEQIRPYLLGRHLSKYKAALAAKYKELISMDDWEDTLAWWISIVSLPVILIVSLVHRPTVAGLGDGLWLWMMESIVVLFAARLPEIFSLFFPRSVAKNEAAAVPDSRTALQAKTQLKRIEALQVEIATGMTAIKLGLAEQQQS